MSRERTYLEIWVKGERVPEAEVVTVTRGRDYPPEGWVEEGPSLQTVEAILRYIRGCFPEGWTIKDKQVVPQRPRIVCLCGSTRFSEAYQQANLEETLADRIVLTIGADMKSDAALFEKLALEKLEEIKTRLDWLHLRKIDLADEILVLNVKGYIGESTRREVRYAMAKGKRVRWLEPHNFVITCGGKEG